MRSLAEGDEEAGKQAHFMNLERLGWMTVEEPGDKMPLSLSGSSALERLVCCASGHGPAGVGPQSPALCCPAQPSPNSLPGSPGATGAGLHLLGGRCMAGAAGTRGLPGARPWPSHTTQQPPAAPGRAGGPGGAAPEGLAAGPAGASGCSRDTHQGGGPLSPVPPPTCPDLI